MKSVSVSSTTRDLERHRKSVHEAIADLDGWECVCMDHFGARDAGPRAFGAELVSRCDLFVVLVGLVGHTYGESPPGSEESFTELEWPPRGISPSYSRRWMVRSRPRTPSRRRCRSTSAPDVTRSFSQRGRNKLEAILGRFLGARMRLMEPDRPSIASLVVREEP